MMTFKKMCISSPQRSFQRVEPLQKPQNFRRHQSTEIWQRITVVCTHSTQFQSWCWAKSSSRKGKCFKTWHIIVCTYIMALCQNFSLSTNPEIERVHVQYLQKAKDTQYAFQGSKCLKLIKTIKKIKSNATGKRFIIFLISKHFHMPTQ